MTTLFYRSGRQIEDLAINDCVLRGMRGTSGAVWWELWFRVVCSDGVSRAIAIPVAVNGDPTENGPGGMTWGLRPMSTPSSWKVDPSINVVAHPSDPNGHLVHQGPHPTGESLWHETPQIVGVPATERWVSGGAP
jgi:hypothetical protein